MGKDKDKEEARSVEVSSVAFEQVGSRILSLIQRQRVALSSQDEVGGSEGERRKSQSNQFKIK